MMDHLREAAVRLGIADRVVLMDRFPFARLPVLYSLADVFVAPSLWENFANTLLEAMACGRPLVTTTTGGGPEMVEEPANGLLVPPGDSAKLAEAILTLFGDEGLRAEMGGRNRRKAVECYTREKMAAGIVEVCRTVAR